MGANLFRDTGTTGRVKAMPRDERGIDGIDYTYALAHTTLTDKTHYRINFDEYGPLTAAFSGNTSRNFRVGVATEATATGKIAKLVVGGYVQSMVVNASLSMAVGEAISVAGGTDIDDAADYTGDPDQYAICVTATSSITTCSVFLPGKYITASA